MLTLPAQIKNSSTSHIFQHNLVCVTWEDAVSINKSSCKSSGSTVASNYIFITCESKTGQQLIVVSSRQGILEEIWFYFRRAYLCMMTWIDWSFLKCQMVVLCRKSAGLPRCISFSMFILWCRTQHTIIRNYCSLHKFSSMSSKIMTRFPQHTLTLQCLSVKSGKQIHHKFICW